MLKKLFNPKSYTYFLGFTFVIVIIFIFLRLLHLPQSIGFGSDAGRDFLAIWNIYQEKEITLIGPPSQYAFNGRQFFFGPAPYYIMLPGLFLGNWDVIYSSYYLVFINTLVFIVGLFILERGLKKEEKFVVYPYAIFCTVTPILVDYSRTYWNPYFMLPISMLLVPLLVWVRNFMMTIWIALLFGFLFGIGMQLHYSFILTICISILFLLFYRKLSLFGIMYMALGFGIGFSPLIIFELGKGFYNTRTFLLVLQNWERIGTSGFPLYYLISLLPFVFLLLSFALYQMTKRLRLLIPIVLIAYTIVSLLFILPVPSHGYGMVEGWNYDSLKTTATLIKNDNPENFNIVDQLTLDNRAMALRYLLTVQGNMPKGIDEYKNIDLLYIYSQA